MTSTHVEISLINNSLSKLKKQLTKKQNLEASAAPLSRVAVVSDPNRPPFVGFAAEMNQLCTRMAQLVHAMPASPQERGLKRQFERNISASAEHENLNPGCNAVTYAHDEFLPT